MTETPETPKAPEPADGAEPTDGAERTGHPQVDEALDTLDRVAARPPAEQIAEYDAVHRTLQETLATIDEGRS